jgi:uncharacterized protein (TIGR04255 family)
LTIVPMGRDVRVALERAVIEIRGEPSGEVELESLALLAADQGEHYSVTHPYVARHMDVSADGTEISTTEHRDVVGHVACNVDRSESVFFTLSGFKFEQKSGAYESWHGLRGRALRGWSSYQSAVRPRKVGQIAVLYEHRLSAAEGGADSVLECLAATPRLSIGSWSLPSNFYTQFELPLPEFDAKVHVVESLEPEFVVLELRVVKLLDEGLLAATEHRLEDWLDRLKRALDGVFEASIVQ